MGENGASHVIAHREPLGVIVPWNFPMMIGAWKIAPALAEGNSVVVKPPETASLILLRLAALAAEAGLPDGVLEIVHGAATTGGALAAHEDVDGVLFTGSWATGRALQGACLDQPGKLLALELGGRNAIAVLSDADLDLAVAESALSIAVTTGQRCSCASRLFVHHSLIDVYQERLTRVLAGLRLGGPADESAFMGPLIHEAAHARLQAMRARAGEAGGERVLEAAPDLPAPWVGAGLVRFSRLDQSHPYQREELFGPEACLYPIDDLDQAIDAINDSDYGLVASIFGARREHYEHAIGRVRTGLLNWNKGTTGASGKLPFGGEKRSGNARPAGITSTLYTTYPQAHLEAEPAFDAASLPPGMPRP